MFENKTAGLTCLYGAVLIFLAIAAGTFGSHALSIRLEQTDMLRVFDIANRYHFYNSFGLILCGLMWSSGSLFKWQKYCSVLMLLGTILFSGSLYLLALGSDKGIGLITPVGGVLLLVAWSLVVADLVSGVNRSRMAT